MESAFKLYCQTNSLQYPNGGPFPWLVTYSTTCLCGLVQQMVAQHDYPAHSLELGDRRLYRLPADQRSQSDHDSALPRFAHQASGCPVMIS